MAHRRQCLVQQGVVVLPTWVGLAASRPPLLNASHAPHLHCCSTSPSKQTRPGNLSFHLQPTHICLIASSSASRLRNRLLFFLSSSRRHLTTSFPFRSDSDKGRYVPSLPQLRGTVLPPSPRTAASPSLNPCDNGLTFPSFALQRRFLEPSWSVPQTHYSLPENRLDSSLLWPQAGQACRLIYSSLPPSEGDFSKSVIFRRRSSPLPPRQVAPEPTSYPPTTTTATTASPIPSADRALDPRSSDHVNSQDGARCPDAPGP